MRKYTFGWIVLVIFTLFNIWNIEEVEAADHKLEDLHIHVTIASDGSAKIVERRVADLSEGTENYIVIENLGRSTIRDFIVKEDGKTYEYIDNWDIDASREEKAFKNGLITTDNGYELSWGIGEYGKHEYVVEYVITDFIKQLEDSQMLFWRFVNDQTNIPPEKVTVEIETDKQLSEEQERIWAFGFPGDVHFVDGKVIATSSEPLHAADYVTILEQFTDEIFATEDYIDQAFDEVQEKAFEGSDYGKEEPRSSSSSSGFGFLFSIIKSIFNIIIIGALVIGLIIASRFYGSSSLTYRKPRTFQRRYKEEYYRDYPYEGNYLHAYYLVYLMGISSFKTLFTAVLLKWIKEERIMIEADQDSGFFRRNKIKLTILDREMETNSAEGKLFAMIKSAAGAKGVLHENQLAKWTERNRKRLYQWEKSVMNESTRALEESNHVVGEEKKLLFMKRKDYIPTNTGKELEQNVYKYVNYLHDFSLLHEHEAINVKLWDEIMIWAAYLGLTTVVMKQFKSLYPRYTEETMYKEETVDATRRLADRTAKSRSTSSSRSSGRGGRASRGGGGGSFGGGRGGGTR